MTNGICWHPSHTCLAPHSTSDVSWRNFEPADAVGRGRAEVCGGLLPPSLAGEDQELPLGVQAVGRDHHEGGVGEHKRKGEAGSQVGEQVKHCGSCLSRDWPGNARFCNKLCLQ